MIFNFQFSIFNFYLFILISRYLLKQKNDVFDLSIIAKKIVVIKNIKFSKKIIFLKNSPIIEKQKRKTCIKTTFIEILRC